MRSDVNLMKYIKQSFIVLIIFTLVSCTFLTLGISDITTGIDRLSERMGKNVNFLINEIGYPTDEKIITGKKFYIWESGLFKDDGVFCKNWLKSL